MLILSVILISCTHLQHQGLWKQKKGMSPDEIIKIIDDNRGTSISEYNDKAIVPVTLDKNSDPGKYDIIITRKIIAFNKQYVVYTFKDNKLIFWGTPLEYASHDSQVMNEIGVKIGEILDKM